MENIIETVQNNGKILIKHAQKHHRKYLIGAAGFFGLFKIFSFIIISIFTTTAIGADLSNTITTAIPAATIDIQDNEEIIQFDLSKVDIGEYSSIKSINLEMNIDTDQEMVVVDSFRNDTAMNLGQTDGKNVFPLHISKSAENTRTIADEDLPQIITQLSEGKSIVYLFPQENIIITEKNIFMTIETTQTAYPTEEIYPVDTTGTTDTYTEENNNTAKDEVNGNEETGENEAIYTGENTDIEALPEEMIITGNNEEIFSGTENSGTSEEIPIETIDTSATTDYYQDIFSLLEDSLGALENGSGTYISGYEEEDLSIDICGSYQKKKDCENDEGCKWSTKTKTCTAIDTITAIDTYEIDITNKKDAPIETTQDIEIQSDEETQKIRGFIKISKNTTYQTDATGAKIYIHAPTLITDQNLRGTTQKKGIPKTFTHIQTIEAGDPNASIAVISGSEGFTIQMEIMNMSMIPGTILHIYTSQNGESRENLGTTCTIDDQNICTFTTPHLTLFTVGTMTWNNLQFLDQDFRNQNPTDGQIIDALFGTGGNPSAYTIYRSTGCRPTNVMYVTLSDGMRLTGNNVYIIQNSFSSTIPITIRGDCIAVIDRGGTIIKKVDINLINNDPMTGLIIQGVKLLNSGYGYNGIYLSQATNVTLVGINSQGGTTPEGNQISISDGKNIAIYDSIAQNGNSAGIYTLNNENLILDNIHIYNNSVGYISSGNKNVSINNSLFYNNGNNNGINAYYTTGLVINNSIIYNNASYGILLNNCPNVQFREIKIFNNSSQASITNSNGRYFDQNTIYPNNNLTNFTSSGAITTLGRGTGTLNTGNAGFSCDFVASPYQGTWMYTNTGSNGCTDIGKIYRGGGITTYLYGNNMIENKYVPKQKEPVYRINNYLSPLSIYYFGHRFIGEFYNDIHHINQDINPPVAFFTGETPPQGTNIYSGAYSGTFTIRSYIFEPNISSLYRYENFPGYTTNYPIYDSGLLFISNFDNIKEIGDTSTIAKDLSLSKNFGNIFNTVVWTGNGKRSGAYLFPGGTTGGIIIADQNLLESGIQTTLSARIKPSYIPSRNSVNDIITKKGAYYMGLSVTGGSAKLLFAYYNTGGTLKGRYPSTATIPLNVWTHVTISRSGSDVEFFINGQNDTNYTADNFSYRYYISMPTIGGVRSGLYPNGNFDANRAYSGLIDEPRIRNRALSSGEIHTLYMSNLSARSDHREYTINYTGVQSRPIGRYTYGYNTTLPITDQDDNTTSTTGYLIKSYLSCGTGFGINRDNTKYIDSGFRNQNPSSCDIIYALYGTGSDGNDSTAYTNYRSGRTGQCNRINSNVIYLTGGTNKLSNITGNTVYVLAPGNYIEGKITMQNCNAIIGTTGTINIYSTGQINVGQIGIDSRYQDIIDGVILNNTGGGPVAAHTGNTYGIYVKNGYDTTIHNLISSYASSDSIEISNSNFTTIANLISYNNTRYGIYHYGSNTRISDSQIFSNVGGAGIYFTNTNSNITINNLQSYNNMYGIQFNNDTSYKDYITLNNSQIHNNSKDGIFANYTRYITINNSHIYSNGQNGIYFAGSYNSSGILNNVSSYNNGNRGVNSESGYHKYYGKLTTFGNTLGNLYIPGGSLTAGSSITYTYLGRTGGTTDTSNCMACSRISNPRKSSYQFLIDTTTYPHCEMQGVNTSRTGENNLSYRYGISLNTQQLPVTRSSGSLTGSSLLYTGSQYVAEVNKLTPDYTNAQCSCVGHTYRRNNDNFIDDSFWNNHPDYCDIIAALYGTTGTDSTAYTNLRTSAWTGQCTNTDTMEVRYLTEGTGKIDYTMSPNVIYVLGSGNYIQTGTISTNNCNAVIGSTTGSIQPALYSTGQLTAGMFRIYTPIKYNIIDNIAIHGTGGGPVDPHTGNVYGIYISTSINNTINNIETDYHAPTGVGIGLYGSSNIRINNVRNYYNQMGIHIQNSTYNTVTNFINGLNGYSIYIYYSNNNIIDSGTSYGAVVTPGSARGIDINNSSNTIVKNFKTYNNYYGCLIEQNSINTTLENIQSYSNYRGIDASYNTTINNAQVYNNYVGIALGKNNILNNVQVYNCFQDGIGFLYTGINIMNNVRSYNNYYGIRMRNGSTGSYYGDIRFFGNTLDIVSGENLFTGYSTDFPSLGLTTGQISTGRNVSRDYMTNPIDTGGSYLTPRSGTVGSSIRSYQTYYYGHETEKYSYGSGIFTKVQPLIRSGNDILLSGSFDPTQYIGSSQKRYTGSLLGIGSRAGTTGIFLVSGSADPIIISNYSLFGNIFAFKIGQPINTNTGIHLTSGDGVKRIITQIYSGSDFATHFEKDVTLETTIRCLTGWDNNNFLTNSFWSANPSNGNIICALYGTGPNDMTAYTQYRSGRNTTQCSGILMNVIYIDNLNTNTLTTNTIYILTGQTSTGTTTITMANCSAIISKQNTGTIMRSTTYLSNGTIRLNNNAYDIIDNIQINATGGGIVPTHAANEYGIDIAGISYDNTFHQVDIHEANSAGIREYNGSDTITDNIFDSINLYDNAGHGFFGNGTQRTYINNCKVYNNFNGISFLSTNNIINNTQAFNNNNYGLWLNIAGNTINNTIAYNNLSYGIYLQSSGILNNIFAYNNGGYSYSKGISLGAPTYFYGDNKIFGNVQDVNNIAYILTGSTLDYPNLGRTTGNIDTGKNMSRDYLTNPINTSSAYLLSWSGTRTGMKGIQSNYMYTTTDKYSYGSGIALQKQPVYYSGATLKTGGIFSGTQYIGSNTLKITGSLLGLPSATASTGLIVSGNSSNPLISNYSLFGNITEQKIGQLINTNTGISLAAGIPINRIITQLRNPGGYFATHFEQDTSLDISIHCMTGWNNDNFITSGFRSANPTDENIICALYGTGPNDTTAYTLPWSGWDTTQCNGIFMNVVHTGQIPEYFSANTIYVIESGTYHVSTTRNMESCNALISSGNAKIVIDTQNTTAITIDSKQNDIIDNIELRGTTNSESIYFYGSNLSMNKIQSHDNNAGVGIYTIGNNILFNDTHIYNNGNGIYMGYNGHVSINNMQLYNNNGDGGMFIEEACEYCNFNNMQIYNNSYGISAGGLLDTNFNNMQIYNNNYGLTIYNASDTNFNSIEIYNNNYGIVNNNSTNTRYYGSLDIYGNGSNTYGILTTGSSSDYPSLGWQTGIFTDTGTLSRDYMTNPINENNRYLIAWSGTWTGIRDARSNYTGKTMSYSYGSGIFMQIQPILRSGTDIITGMAFDGTKYIGSDVMKVTGNLEGIPTQATGLSLIITGTASNSIINKYSLFGNITEYKIGQDINTSTGITFTTGLAIYKIITQLFYDPNGYFATHFEQDMLGDIVSPSKVILLTPANSGFVTTGNVPLAREDAIDTGAGMGTYVYQVSTGAGFTTFITSGTTANTGAIASGLSIGTTYYRRVYAIDNFGNTGLRSDIWNFTITIPIDCNPNRNNDNFIDDSFRALNPSSQNIICALYGSGNGDQTAYTQYRSGYSQSSCLDQGMGVTYISPGTANIPLNTQQDMIYVLSSGAYIQSGAININKCAAIIGSTGTSILYTSTGLTDTYYGNMIQSFNTGNQYTITDKITLDGTEDGNGGSHIENIRGMRFNNGNDNTMHALTMTKFVAAMFLVKDYNIVMDSDIFQTDLGIRLYGKYSRIIANSIHNGMLNSIGMYLLGATNNLIESNDIYSNTNGIYLYNNSNQNIISGCTIHENNIGNAAGITIASSSSTQILNTTLYNNGYGIDIGNVSTAITINNVMIYNNYDYGINGIGGNNININNAQIFNNENGIYIDATGNIINNVQIYNNSGYSLYLPAGYSTLNNVSVYNNTHGISLGGNENYYYGNINYFHNIFTSSVGGTQGTGTYRSSLGRATGNLINTGLLSRDYFTNPLNTTDYLLPWTGTRTGIIGNIANYSGTITTKYSYGSGIMTQGQAATQSGGTILPRGDFDATKYIGSTDTIKLTGNAIISETAITGQSSNGVIERFSVFGDILSPIIGQTINTNTGFSLITGLQSNRIVTQLRGTSYFATHFENKAYSTPPIIFFTGSTPASGSIINYNHFRPQIGIINTGNLDTFSYTLNNITYPYYDSGLVLIMNLDNISALGEDSTTIKDFSQYGNNGIAYNGATWTGNGFRNGAYILDGTDDYISIDHNDSLDFTGKYTLSIRINLNAYYGYEPIFMRGNSGQNDIELYIENSNSLVLLHNRDNGQGYSFFRFTPPPLHQWTLMTITYSGGDVGIYYDGSYFAGSNINPPLDTNKKRFIGYTDHPAFGVYRNLNATIDEPRIWNRALTSGEILQMYRSNFQKISQNQRLFTDDRQCIADGIYTYTGYVSNSYQSHASTGRTNTASIQAPTPYAPTGYYLGSTGVSQTQVTLSGQFTGYFKLEDREGTSGRYTTIQLPLAMSGINYTTNAIDRSHIYFMATGLDTISGTTTNQVYLTGGISSYQSFSGSKSYIIRDFTGGYSCPAGVYGNKPYLRVDIPARQNPDTYSGLITIDINN